MAEAADLGKGLLTILEGVGLGLSGHVGELHAREERQQQRILAIAHENPDMLEIPEIAKSVQKTLHLSKEGFESYKMHAHVSNMAGTLAKSLGISTETTQAKQPPARRSMPLQTTASASSPEGAGAVAQVPTTQVARPQADILGDGARALPAGRS